MESVDIKAKFELFREQWSPKVIAKLNDYHFKIARIEGDFTWHKHDETDEMFLVIEGSIRMDFEDRRVICTEGQMIVVPKGVVHKPHADKEAKILMVEPAGTLNTGDVTDEFTKNEVDWI